MKRASILLVSALLLLAVATGCSDDEHSTPTFTRLRVTPTCGVSPLFVEGYAILTGGNETGDPLGANNTLEIKWDFGDGGTGSTTRDFHTYHTDINTVYTIRVTGTDPDGRTARDSIHVVVWSDSLVMEASSDFPDGIVTTEDIIHFNIKAFSCDINFDTDPGAFKTVPGDSVKMVFKWEMGDETVDDPATEYNVTAPDFRYDTPGDYAVKVTVFYPYWAVYRSQTLNFTVNDP